MSKLSDLLIAAVQTYKWLTQEVIPRTHPNDLPDASTRERAVRPLGGWKGAEDVPTDEADVSHGNEG